MFHLDEFINTYVTRRQSSMFEADISDNSDALFDAIEGKSVLVVGGAGSIGSSFIRAILPFQPSELVIVDTNENALTELTRDLRSIGNYMPDVYLPYPMDYSSVTFQRMFRAHKGFEIVANFSAHKHVRSEKTFIRWKRCCGIMCSMQKGCLTYWNLFHRRFISVFPRTRRQTR